MHKVKILQVNLNRCRAAHDLLDATVTTKHIDICVVSEPNHAIIKRGGWVSEEEEGAAIKIVNRNIGIQAQGGGKGFTWIRTGEVVLYSCYMSPSKPLNEFVKFLSELEDNIQTHKGKRIVVTGDFNSAGTEWGSKYTNARGKELSEWAARNELEIANDGQTPTFARRTQESFIDLTMRSETVDMSDWQVLEEETFSDHRYIIFTIGGTDKQGETARRWRSTRANIPKLTKELLRTCDTIEEPNDEDLDRALRKACEAASKPVHPRTWQKTPKYWWTAEIAAARSECNKIRRKLKRGRARGDTTNDVLRQYRGKKSELKLLILRSKENKWKELVAQIEEDPWGEGYQIVAKRIGSPSPHIPDEIADKAIRHLFPTHPERPKAEQTSRTDEETMPPITTQEVIAAAERIKGGKAPGLDGVPPEVVKMLMKERPTFFKTVADKLLTEGRFPKQWKTGRLVLLPKPGKPPGEPSSYRPLCLLNTVGKAMEGILAGRLVEELEAKSALSDAQHGFRRKRSTVTAIEQVLRIAEEERNKTLKTRKFCLVVLLDVKNAFNSIAWDVIQKSLLEGGISGYIRRTIDSYLEDRAIKWKDRTYKMTAGVPQGSVLGPILWCAAYDGVLRLKYPEGVTPVAYADDLALVITDRNEQILEWKANEAIEKVVRWMEERKLELAPQKTEAVLLTGRKKYKRELCLTHSGHEVRLKKEVKYLGVMLDQGMTFSTHVRYATTKAGKSVSALTRLMPRAWGAGERKRRLLAMVANSVATYAAPVWKIALTKQRNINTLRSTQRVLSIRICRAYRTVATLTAMVIARQVPWDYIVKEREAIYTDGVKIDEAREKTMDELQAEWNSGVTTWTRRLIPNVRKWYEREHGETTYHITQILTGHGCFQAYLHRIGKAANPSCIMCTSGEIDDSEHTLLRCEHFREGRLTMEKQLGTQLSVDNIVPLMLEGEKNWMTIQMFMEIIMREKESLERRRRQREGDNATGEERRDEDGVRGEGERDKDGESGAEEVNGGGRGNEEA